jgi:hypothetical protein
LTDISKELTASIIMVMNKLFAEVVLPLQEFSAL